VSGLKGFIAVCRNDTERECFDRILKILHLALLKYMSRQLRKNGQAQIRQQLKDVLSLSFLINEFLYLRRFCLTNRSVRSVLKRYYDEKDKALFGKLRED